jgi:hypothetical protein
MSLAHLPRRTDDATLANAVRRPLFGFALLQRVTLDDADGARAIIIGRRQTPGYGFAEYLTQRFDNRAQAWVMEVNLSPTGTPRLTVVDGGRP